MIDSHISRLFYLQWVVFLGLFFLIGFAVSAQQKIPQYEFINTNDGFPKRGVTEITTDDRGFIWIGTLGAGLYKYDGISYTSFRYDFKDTTSINSNIVNVIFKDESNKLWIGTDGGLNIYNRALSSFSTIAFDYKKDDNEKNIVIVAITEDAEGRIFLGSNYYGLFVIHPGTQVAVKAPFAGKEKEQFPFDILNFATSASGMIYVATNQGLKQYDTEKQVLKDAAIHTESGETTLDMPLSSLMIDELNNLWIGSQRMGIYKTSCLNAKQLSLKYLEHFPITQKRVLSLAKDKEGYILCGTENDGLFVLNQAGQTLDTLRYDKNAPKGVKSNSIWEIFFDKENRLWLGYYDKGVDVFDPNYRKFNSISNLVKNVNALNDASVTGLVADKNGGIWFGMDGGGLKYYNKNTQIVTPFLDKNYPVEIHVAIQTVFIDRSENVWAGSWDEGIFLLTKGAKEFINFTIENTNGELSSNRILTFAEDSKGTIWFGTFGRGFHSYDPQNQEFRNYDIPELKQYGIANYDIRKLLIDGEDQLWVGSTKGLFKIGFNEQKHPTQVVSFRDKWSDEFKEQISFNSVLSLFKAQNGDLWIGTDGAGLLRYQIEKDSLSVYNPKNGFAQETVSAIIEAAENQMWISGRSGISHINLENGHIKNYSEKDGLISNDFNNNAVLKDKKGGLYFGNVLGGINYFVPDSIPTNKSDIQVYLSNLKLFNKTVLPGEENSPLSQSLEVTKSITLNYLQSVFTIEYTGVNFTRSEKNQFAYYLEGLEDDWNYVGNQRSATYTSLKNGDYVFKVKAANNDGLWNEEPVTLQIKVLPPWWKSKAGYLLYLLISLVALYVFYRMMRMRVLAKEEIENERQRREQEKELNKKKFQFFTNISHEFRTPLTLILNPLEDILNDHDYDLPDEVHSKHLIIHKNSKRLERLINELMDFRKLSFNKLKVRVRNTEIVLFVNSVAEYFEGEAIDMGIEFGVESAIDSQYVWIDSGLIEKVLFNLLSNAFKVTTAGGKITMHIDVSTQIFPAIDEKEAKPALSIAVSDTGPGLSSEHIQHIFERFYQVENLNKSYYGGTGIGLEVVNNFIKLHKGKIQVESKLGVGTQFMFYLPIGKNYFPDAESSPWTSKMDERSVPTKVAEGSVEDKSSAKTKTLLIVEDNAELSNYLQSELKKIYQIKTAADGLEGLQIAIEILPDVIITDIMMPKMDGFGLCKKIKSDIRTCHIPLLMLTAKNNADDQVLGIDSGADAFISKPFNMHLLKSTLNQLLTSRQIIFNKYFSDISESKINKNTNALDKDFIQKILKLIYKRIGDTNLNVESLAAEVFLSRSQLYRKIKALTGLNVNAFIRKIRLEEAKKTLENGNINISEVCYAVGFSSPSYFSKCFREHFGQLPTDVVNAKVKDKKP
ncbi:MAG: two-component regulator propeller domain-containing protein [Chitinophagales bacterium]